MMIKKLRKLKMAYYGENQPYLAPRGEAIVDLMLYRHRNDHLFKISLGQFLYSLEKLSTFAYSRD